MDRDTFKRLAKTYTAIPVYRVLMADTVTPVSLFLRIREDGKMPFLLESVEGGEQLARYSFLGRNPYQVLTYSQNEVKLTRTTDNASSGDYVDDDTKSDKESLSEEPGCSETSVTEVLNESYFDALKRLCMTYKEPEIADMPRLTGGAVGFSAYDTVRQVEELPDAPPDDLDLPEAIWSFYDEIFAFDHVKHRVVLIKTVFTDSEKDHERQYEDALSDLDRMEGIIDMPVTDRTTYRNTSEKLRSNFEKKDYKKCVDKAKEYIHAGDIFQVVLSQRFQSTFEGDRFMLYRALRMVNPSPYLFFLDFGDFALVGSSPEVLVQVQGDEVRLLPIAGTRPRGKSLEEDRAFEEELKNDPKELAEHIMLVDLGRNDLSRVCVPQTVELSRDRVIERYSHVMHIVSDVRGRLMKQKTAVDALMNCFPAGTVSGAPKVRAMQIIDEMEPTKRGPYAGAVGYFDFSGNMDTCIAIRTMVVTDRDIFIQAGAGIVADSNPEKEFDETVNKAKALVKALEVALKLE